MHSANIDIKNCIYGGTGNPTCSKINKMRIFHREVDAIPQIVHCLQTVEINPQFRVYCVENIFNSSINRPVVGAVLIKN
jgi:hypothetical protein